MSCFGKGLSWFKTSSLYLPLCETAHHLRQWRLPIRERSTRVFRDPISELQVFPHFTAFVAVFFRFVWPVIDLSEGVFGIANYIRDYVECLGHGSDPLLCIPETAISEKSANPP